MAIVACLQTPGRSDFAGYAFNYFAMIVAALGMTALQATLQASAGLQPRDMSVICFAS